MKSLVFSQGDSAQLSLLDLKFDILRDTNVKISKEALHKRFTPEAVAFLEDFLSKLISGQIVSDELKGVFDDIFTGIYIKDSTKFKIPGSFAMEYPSYGSFGKNTSLMNIQYEFELLSGSCQRLYLTKATRNDQQDSRESLTDIKKGGLYLRDLGYITPRYLEKVEREQAFYLNRLPKIGVYQKVNGGFKKVDWNKIDKIFNTTTLNILELEVYLGKRDRQKTRLIISPVPDHVANDRIRKAQQGGERTKGYKLSKEYKLKARYSLYITNIPRQDLNAMKIVQAYRLRWQVELIFKTWKSNLSIHKYKPMKLDRFKCQLIAKLIWIVLHTKLFQIANLVLKRDQKHKGISLAKFFKYCKTTSYVMRYIVNDHIQLMNWFYESIVPILDDLTIEKRLDKKTHCEILAYVIAH